jgi:hypothetical protein
VEPPAAINISPLRGEATASEARNHAAISQAYAPLPFTIYHLRFTTQMIGFDRSAFVAGPRCGLGNQNVNRVTLQFMTKVFRSVLSKIRSLTDLLKVHQSRNQQRSEILASISRARKAGGI